MWSCFLVFSYLITHHHWGGGEVSTGFFPFFKDSRKHLKQEAETFTHMLFLGNLPEGRYWKDTSTVKHPKLPESSDHLWKSLKPTKHTHTLPPLPVTSVCWVSELLLLNVKLLRSSLRRLVGGQRLSDSFNSFNSPLTFWTLERN